jgi:hypothetical protein
VGIEYFMANLSCPRFINDALEVVETRVRGRTVMARLDISSGQDLLQEVALAIVPLNSTFESTLSLSIGPHAANPIEQNMLQYAAAQGYPGVGRTAMLAARCLSAIHRSPVQQHWWDALVYHVPTSQTKLENLFATASIVHRLLQSVSPHLAGYTTMDDCKIALMKLSANAFTITDDRLQEAGHGLYLTIAAINHDCNPNCLQCFASDGRLTVRSIRHIRAGEEITICYLDSTRPTWWRKKELLSYGFDCNCCRCNNLEEQEGYRCSTSGCGGLLTLNKKQCDRFKQWRTDSCVNFKPAISDASMEARAVDLTVPFGDVLFQIHRQHNFPSADLFCTTCAAVVPLEKLTKRVVKLFETFEELRMVTTNGRLSSNTLHRCEQFVAQAETLLHPAHASFVQCLQQIVHVVEGFLFHAGQPIELECLIHTRYVYWSSRCFELNNRLFPGLHPLPVLHQVALLSHIVEIGRELLMGRYVMCGSQKELHQTLKTALDALLTKRHRTRVRLVSSEMEAALDSVQSDAVALHGRL